MDRVTILSFFNDVVDARMPDPEDEKPLLSLVPRQNIADIVEAYAALADMTADPRTRSDLDNAMIAVCADGARMLRHETETEQIREGLARMRELVRCAASMENRESLMDLAAVFDEEAESLLDAREAYGEAAFENTREVGEAMGEAAWNLCQAGKAIRQRLAGLPKLAS